MDWMLVMWIVLIVVGFALLVKGADWFVDGSAGIAQKCRISPLVVGLTVVAFGTSAPELATSVFSAAMSYSDPTLADVAIGNVVGSNITNILLILGISALIHKLPVQKNSRTLDLPVLLIASALLVGLGIWGNALEWWDGLVMLAVFAAYMTILIVKAKRERAEPAELPAHSSPHADKWWFLLLLTLVGLGMVGGGGFLLVHGAQYVAEYFGVEKRIIGLTVVAIGTSLPELVTSAIAAKKGETDIAVGNVIGSNIFNIFLVAGVACLIHPLPFVMESNLVDALVALAAALLLCLAACFDGHRIGRIGGVVMLACFAAYYVYLFLTPA